MIQRGYFLLAAAAVMVLTGCGDSPNRADLPHSSSVSQPTSVTLPESVEVTAPGSSAEEADRNEPSTATTSQPTVAKGDEEPAPTQPDPDVQPDGPDEIAPEDFEPDETLSEPTETDTPPTPPPSTQLADPLPTPTGVYVPEPLESLPHDREAFIQGLEFYEGKFYESTGLYGQSSVRIVDPATGQVLKQAHLEDQFFGEGLTIAGDRVVQLTWKEQVAFVWDVETLQLVDTYTYEGEGWGLCVLSGQFVMSNGSSQLTFRDLDTFAETGRVDVSYMDLPVINLNELECVNGLIYANVWQTNDIVIIIPENGRVTARIDASNLPGHLSSQEGIDVLNGIAHHPNREVFYLGGKLWPEIFAVNLQPAKG